MSVGSALFIVASTFAVVVAYEIMYQGRRHPWLLLWLLVTMLLVYYFG